MKTLHNTEFYLFEREVHYRDANGEHHTFTEDDRGVISTIYDTIKECYTKAFKALLKEYSRFSWSITKMQFQIAGRFIRCNFGRIDNVNDIDRNGRLNTEHVDCPLRGVCHLEGIVCHPELDTNLGRCTHEVLGLVFQGYSDAEIAEKLGKSPETVRNQKIRGYYKLGVNNKADFIDLAHKNNLFRKEE